MRKLNLISEKHLAAYTEKCRLTEDDFNISLPSLYEIKFYGFEYYLVHSSLYSSKIEGNTLDANSLLRNRGDKSFMKRKEVQEINNLVKAYEFAMENKITKSGFLKAHGIMSKTLVQPSLRGKIRKGKIAVYDSGLRMVYLAVEPQYTNIELSKLFVDIHRLTKRHLSIQEVFYYASMIHVWIVYIHPFQDGNGRAARLLEKWFLATKLGNKAWSVKSEEYYWNHRPEYYKNIALGVNYYELNWNRCLPFLLMLPKSLNQK